MQFNDAKWQLFFKLKLLISILPFHYKQKKKKGRYNPILTFCYEGFPYLALWSKPKAPFICITPWMTTPDSINGSGVFRQKTDILLLPPKQEFECKYTVDFF